MPGLKREREDGNGIAERFRAGESTPLELLTQLRGAVDPVVLENAEMTELKAKEKALDAKEKALDAEVTGLKAKKTLGAKAAEAVRNEILEVHRNITAVRTSLAAVRASLGAVRRRIESAQNAARATKDEAAIFLRLPDETYREVPSRFDLQYLDSLDWTKTNLKDCMCEMTFTGRNGFLSGVLENIQVAMEGSTMNRKPFAVVFAAGSGTGKTVGLLQLQHFFQTVAKDDAERARWLKSNSQHEKHALLAAKHDFALVYCGFSTDLSLTDEEIKWIKFRGEDGAEEVLARRLLGMAAFAIANPTNVGYLPDGRKVFDGRDFPRTKESLSMLGQLLSRNRPEPFKLVVGLDEMQILDKSKIKLKNDEKCGLGRFFLRKLKAWRDHGVILPVATGVAVDFSTQVTESENRVIAGGDAVLIRQQDFQTLTYKRLFDIEKDDVKFVQKFKCTRPVAVRWLATVLWPRVRSVQYLKDLAAGSRVEDFNPTRVSVEELPKWRDMYIRYLRGDCATAEEYAGISSQFFPFELHGMTDCLVVPTGMTSKVFRDAIHATENRFLRLMIALLPCMRPITMDFASSFAHGNSQWFEECAFAVLGCSIHVGLRSVIDHAETTCARLSLARWLQDHLQYRFTDLLDNAQAFRDISAAYYPFTGAHQTTFCAEMLEALILRVPLYVCTGAQAKADCFFLFPKGGPAAKEWVAVICKCDAKFTSSPDSSIDVVNQIKLLNACELLVTALGAAGHSLSAVRLAFVTNRKGLSAVDPDNVEFNAAASQVRTLLPQHIGVRMTTRDVLFLVLKPDTFEFAPFSNIMFAFPYEHNEQRSAD